MARLRVGGGGEAAAAAAAAAARSQASSGAGGNVIQNAVADALAASSQLFNSILPKADGPSPRPSSASDARPPREAVQSSE
jgi:hypothetical protein